MRLAYLDPPYIDLAEEYYADHPDFDGEVDHVELLERACDEFPDGWALSCSARTLPAILQLRSCPADVRVAAWVRGERPTRSWRPLNAWEPVVWRGGRERLQPVEHRRLDAVVHTSRPRLTDPNRVVGAKPARFIWWLFELLGLLPGDELVDVFPGSGGVARAWSYVSGLTTVDA